MMDSDCARRGPDGNRVRAYTTIDSMCGNATITVEKLKADIEPDACKQCTSDVRDNDCGASDLRCVFDKCEANSECQACGLDCEETFKVDFCGICLWHDFPMSGSRPAKTKLRIKDAWDRFRNSIGGAWGHKSAVDIISNDLEIKVINWGGLGTWRYRKHFGLKYDSCIRHEWDTDKSKVHCEEYITLSAAESRNRYKSGWDCY